MHSLLHGVLQVPEAQAVTITDEELARLEALAQAVPEDQMQAGWPDSHVISDELVDFLQAAHHAVPVLIDEVRALRDHGLDLPGRLCEAKRKAESERDALRAEVRALQGEVESWARVACSHGADADALRAENQRLQMLTAGIPQLDGWRAGIEAERDALRAENERLRAIERRLVKP